MPSDQPTPQPAEQPPDQPPVRPTNGAATLVVGAGQAGISLVGALRELGDDRPVVLVGDEPLPPYERPPLSKSYLRGEHDDHPLVLRPAAWFAGHGVELVTGDAVATLHRDAEGGEATLASGRRIAFDRLALTTGASARPLGLPGADLPGVHVLRTVADADRLRAALDGVRRVVVVGGGFIGLEVAASLTATGREATVVEVADRLLPRSVTDDVSAFLLDAHAARGTRILLGHNAVRVAGEKGSGARAVVLDDGTELAADLVVVGVGALPRTDLARSLGLDVEAAGIVVDEHARTSDGVTVAAGDCTLAPNPFSRGRSGPRRLESVPHATDHARTAAATLLGRDEPYRAVPWFWSDQGDLRLQMVGLPMDAEESVVRGDPASGAFSVLGYRRGLLVSAECLGSPHDYVAVKRGLEKNLTIDPDAAADAGVPLRRLLRPARDAELP